MDNPFKQLLPEGEPPQQEVQEKVMSSIRLKSLMAQMMEFFLAVFGITFRDSLPVSKQSEGEEVPPH